MLSSSYIETTLDEPRFDEPRKVTVYFSFDPQANELDEIEIKDEEGNDVSENSLTDQQRKNLYEEIWDDIRQNESY